MDRKEFLRIGREAQWRLEDINAADTAKNEARLIPLFVAHGLTVRRLAINGPQRYVITCADGSVIERVTLSDMERMLAKLDKNALLGLAGRRRRDTNNGWTPKV